ncbi:MAG: tetratricopeptide repeat protein [Bacteroidota bacterium]
MNFRKACLFYFIFLSALFFSIPAAAQLNINYYMAEGKQRIEKNDYTGAISVFSKIIENAPENFQAYFFRGIAKSELGDKEGAVTDFKQTVAIHNGYSPAYYYLGITQTEQKEYYEAISSFNKAIALNNLSSDYYNARGYARSRIMDSTNALLDFATALKLDANNVNAWLNRSILSFDSKKYDQALIDCNIAISKMPANYNSYILRGQIKMFLSDSAGAKRDFEYTVAHDSLNTIAYYYLAGYFHEKDVYDSALYYYSKVVELDSYNAECYYNRASLEAQHEHYAEAETDYTRVLSLNPKNLFAYFYRANVRSRLNNHKGAIEDYTVVVSLYPTFQFAYFLRSGEYQQIKDYRAAETDKKIAEMLITNNNAVQYSEDELASFKKLFEFRSEFENTDTTAGRIQFKAHDIILRPLYNICLVKSGRASEYAKFNAEMARLNILAGKDHNIIFSTAAMNVNFEEGAGLQLKLDSLKQKDADSSALHLLNSIAEGSMLNYAEAIVYCNRIPDSSKYSYLAYFVKGNYHFAMGKQQESDDMDKQLFLFDNTPVNTNNYLDALQDYSACISKNVKFSPGYFNRACVKNVLQDFSGAILDYSLSIFYDNTFAEAYFNRGIVYLFMGNKEAGCKDISKAGELGIKEAYNVLYKYCSQ